MILLLRYLIYKTKFNFVFDYGKNVLSLVDLPPKATILDLGCGNGKLTADLKSI